MAAEVLAVPPPVPLPPHTEADNVATVGCYTSSKRRYEFDAAAGKFRKVDPAPNLIVHPPLKKYKQTILNCKYDVVVK